MGTQITDDRAILSIIYTIFVAHKFAVCANDWQRNSRLSPIKAIVSGAANCVIWGAIVIWAFHCTSITITRRTTSIRIYNLNFFGRLSCNFTQTLLKSGTLDTSFGKTNVRAYWHYNYVEVWSQLHIYEPYKDRSLIITSYKAKQSNTSCKVIHSVHR